MMVHLPLIEPRLWFVCPGGTLGVDVFFALSSFLITSLLLAELNRSGRIDLRRFYIRRALRLLPAFVSVLLFALVVALCVGSLTALGLTQLRLASIVFYFTNWIRAYQGPETWFLGHFWSLAVEEQFYLCWPLLLFIATKFKVTRRTMFWVTCALIAASVIWKCTLLLTGAAPRRIFFGSDTRGDGILVGCALALALSEQMFQSILNAKSSRSLAIIGLLLIASFAALGDDRFPLVYCGGTTAVAFGAVLVIAGSMLGRQRSFITGTMLSNKWLRWVGRRSYGLYLWHWPIYEVARLIPFQSVVAPCAILASVAVAALSYRFIESPFLRMKDRSTDLSASAERTRWTVTARSKLRSLRPPQTQP
jgi:peptidoglycan/LPS O-acetylase OafA/YrhL